MLLQEEFVSFNAKEDFSTNVFDKDVEILINCGSLDKIDSKLLSKGLFSVLLLNLIDTNIKISYNALLEELHTLKATEDYKLIYDKLTLIYENENEIIIPSNSQNLKSKLELLDYTQNDIDDIYNLILDMENELTYGDFFDLLLFPKNTTEYITPEIVDEEYISYFEIFTDYNMAIKISKTQNKPLLFFFNGHACVNSKKMEAFILNNAQVKSIILDNYIPYTVYVDERKILEIEDQYYSEILQRQVKTIGQKNMEFQIRKFQANSQPYFVIINSDEEVIATEGYLKEIHINKFIEFLDKGIK